LRDAAARGWKASTCRDVLMEVPGWRPGAMLPACATRGRQLAPTGPFVTGADRRRVPAAFEPVLAACVTVVAAPRVSLYLYGSVATGVARVGASDVDLLTVGLPEAVAKAVQQPLSDRFRHLTRAVEIGVAHPEDFIGEDDRPYGNRVFLKHYCVLLAGPDRHAALPRAAADARAARGFNGDIDRHYRGWRTALHSEPHGRHLDIVSLGRRVARKTLLAVAGLVSVHDATWTTDRVSAAARWSQLHPSVASASASLVQWSEGVTAASWSRSTGPWLVVASSSRSSRTSAPTSACGDDRLPTSQSTFGWESGHRRWVRWVRMPW